MVCFFNGKRRKMVSKFGFLLKMYWSSISFLSKTTNFLKKKLTLIRIVQYVLKTTKEHIFLSFCGTAMANLKYSKVMFCSAL